MIIIVMVLFPLSNQNLTMFGIDIIVEKGTGHHVVIDINYFPGKSGRFFYLVFNHLSKGVISWFVSRCFLFSS